MNYKKEILKNNSNYQKIFSVILLKFVLDFSPKEIAKKLELKINTINSIIQDFKLAPDTIKFFNTPQLGRKKTEVVENSTDLIIELRKKQLSIMDIKSILDGRDISVSEKQIHTILQQDGFLRLPKRTILEKKTALSAVILEAPKAELFKSEKSAMITNQVAGIFAFLPYLYKYRIIDAIEESNYPSTSTIPKLNSILSILALKFSSIARYEHDDIWCNDPGMGLFAGLNCLPKTTWFSTYSNRITKEMNYKFLKSLNSIWQFNGLLSDTANLDFTTLPFWGSDKEHLGKAWSGTRNKSLDSLTAVLAQDPDSGIICYGDATVDKNKSDVVLEFLDFRSKDGKDNIKYLVFDSKFTSYENLKKLDERKIIFITIRKRGENIIDALNKLPKEEFKKITVPTSKGGREIKVNDSKVKVKHYGELRQIAIVGTKRIKPALIITNDYESKAELIVRKYAQRWLVETEISEHLEFFHLNRLTSSIAIKVDFDLTMTILAHNLYKLLAKDLQGFENSISPTIFRKFIMNHADIRIDKTTVEVRLRKKRTLNLMLEAMNNFKGIKIAHLGNRVLKFVGDSIS